MITAVGHCQLYSTGTHTAQILAMSSTWGVSGVQRTTGMKLAQIRGCVYLVEKHTVCAMLGTLEKHAVSVLMVSL